MQLTSKQKGNLTELQCLSAFVEQGCGVSIPYGDNSKYEFHKDNSHQKKSWQSSESIESEKYIAKLKNQINDVQASYNQFIENYLDNPYVRVLIFDFNDIDYGRLIIFKY